jgi:hypothetical protein
MNSNSQRIFGDIVAVEAWHLEFVAGRTESDLHLEVVFGSAFVGGQPGDKIAFKVQMKRAEVKVVTPSALTVVRDSVWRPGLDTSVEHSRHERRASSTNLSASLNASPTSIVPQLSASGDVGVAQETDTSMRYAGSPIRAMHKYKDGKHCYSFTPVAHDVLDGLALSVDKPVLRFRNNDANASILTQASLQITCRREDLKVSEITPIDPSLVDRISSGIGRSRKFALAIEMIRDAIVGEGLGLPNGLSHDYSLVLVADIVVESD